MFMLERQGLGKNGYHGKPLRPYLPPPNFGPLRVELNRDEVGFVGNIRRVCGIRHAGLGIHEVSGRMS